MIAHSAPTKTIAFDDRVMLAQRYQEVRRTTERLCEPLAVEDQVVQAMPDVSPTKWHLAHVSWFFETFVLRPYLPGYETFEPALRVPLQLLLQRGGPAVLRDRSREPLAADGGRGVCIPRSRRRGMAASWTQRRRARGASVAVLVELGLNHEQQHQELILTDIKYNLAVNPLRPAYHAGSPARRARATRPPALGRGTRAVSHRIGHAGEGFAFDNEAPAPPRLAPAVPARRPPRHQRRVPRLRGCRRLSVVASTGSRRAGARVQERGWDAPLYWEQRDGRMVGHRSRAACSRSILHAPVVHVSYYEADAYARWRGAPPAHGGGVGARRRGRARRRQPAGEPASFIRAPRARVTAPAQIFGDVWEWTAEPLLALSRATGRWPAPSASTTASSW